MNKNNKNSEEFILEVTQEEYDEAIAKGWTDDDISKPGKHIFRRRNRKINPRDAKIKLTFYIEGDVLRHFRKRADGDEKSFENLLNKALRNSLEKDLTEEEKNLDEVAEKLVNNSNFINAIS